MSTNHDGELKIRQLPSAARMGEDIKVLTSLGPRHAGTEHEHQAARYVQQEFAKTGAQVVVEEVPGINAWYHYETRVRVVEPVTQELNAVAILGSGATPKEGVTGEVVYVGRGRMEDYGGKDLKGKFVFREPPRALTLDNVADEEAPQGPTGYLLEKGVAGFIEHARQPGRIVQTDLLSGPGGLPVPAIALTYEDGLYLEELVREWYAVPKGYGRLKDEPVKLWVYVNSESKPSHGLNVVASILGSELPDEKVVLDAHHDNAFGPGACDNATAVAVNLETARVLAQLPRPKRTIEFVSVTAEEYGEIGAAAYVNKHVTDPSKYKGCIVMDIIGNGDHLYYITESNYLGKIVQNSPSLNEYMAKVTADLGYVISPSPLEYASDDGPFITAGVPTSYLCKLLTPSWPWLHTYMDDYSVVDVNGLRVLAEITATTLWRLANE
jgi:hypothetical protein